MMPGYRHALIMGDINTDFLMTNSNFDYNDCVQWNIKDLNYIINDMHWDIREMDYVHSLYHVHIIIVNKELLTWLDH